MPFEVVFYDAPGAPSTMETAMGFQQSRPWTDHPWYIRDVATGDPVRNKRGQTRWFGSREAAQRAADTLIEKNGD